MVITNKEILLPLIARSIKTKFDSNCKIPAINKERIIPILPKLKKSIIYYQEIKSKSFKNIGHKNYMIQK